MLVGIEHDAKSGKKCRKHLHSPRIQQTQGQAGRAGWGDSICGIQHRGASFSSMLLVLGRVEGHNHLLPRTEIPVVAELVVEAKNVDQ